MECFFDFAPMEGITGRVFRRVFNENFKGTDEFYTPFISPKEKRGIDKKDIKEVLPENNEGIKLVPQLLTADGDAFNLAAKRLNWLGYEHINLNLGCPSGTVVNKGKGAGALVDIKRLEALFYKIFEGALKNNMKISLKTRIGFKSEKEFIKLLALYKKYPFESLIIHPRTREEYYREKIHRESFREAVDFFKGEENRLSYNGDINTVSDFEGIKKEFPEINRVMIGRGFLRNPFLIEELKVKNAERERKTRIKNFEEALFHAYVEDIKDENTAVLKMKELWSYLMNSFGGAERYVKDIKKAKNAAEYRSVVNVLFSNCDLKHE